MPLFIISLAIIFLFILIIFFRLNAFIAFIIISLSVGIAQGMNLVDVIESIEKGIGNTLGFLVMILYFSCICIVFVLKFLFALVLVYVYM